MKCHLISRLNIYEVAFSPPHLLVLRRLSYACLSLYTVEELLSRLDDDRDEAAATNIDDLEAEIDDAVYNLFDLTEDEREVMEDYLEVF